MTRNDINRAALAMAETLPEEGMPHSYAVLAFESAGVDEPGAVCQALIDLKIITLQPGHRLVAGPMMAAVKAALAAHRAKEASRG